MSENRDDDLGGYDIRDHETRGHKGYNVHAPDGMLVFRCGDEAAARAKIAKILSGDGHGARPAGMRGA